MLETILHDSLVGMSVAGLPIRTRSKVVKAAVCNALGYSIPESFKKTHPRFPAQNFDTYIQQSLNVQIWNEDISPDRRYVFIGVDENFNIFAVRVISGYQLALLDKTGTLTRKYQATMRHFGENILFSNQDTDNLSDWISKTVTNLKDILPTEEPSQGTLLPINEIFKRLKPLVGQDIDFINATQERNRGAKLHAAICKQLGYQTYTDDGEYPDIVNQLIEVKLQTSPTIDLGLHSPEDGVTVVRTAGRKFQCRDIRYVIFDATLQETTIHLNNIYVVNGANFSQAFPLFKGKVTNAKLQIPLPTNFFSQSWPNI